MKKIITIFLLTSLVGVAQSATPTHNKVVVAGTYVTLGHVFPTAPEDLSETKLLVSPQPGRSILLSQKWLSAVALKHGIDYVPHTNLDSVELIGASDILPIENVEQALKEHLSQIIKNDTFTIKLDNSELKLHMPKDQTGEILITNADINSQQTRFHATMVLQHEGKELSRTKVTGRIYPMTSVPVLLKTVQHGETIKASDIEWQNVPTAQVNQSTITEESALIGATPKRKEILAMRPLNKNDVSIPHMVLKNQSVVIYAESPTINLTAKGKAMENGAKDAYIKVMNVDSKRIFHATVMGPQQVRVEIPTMQTVAETE